MPLSIRGGDGGARGGEGSSEGRVGAEGRGGEGREGSSMNQLCVYPSNQSAVHQSFGDSASSLEDCVGQASPS